MKNLKERKGFGNDNKGPELPREEFNMQEALKNFNKEAEKAKLAAAQTANVVYDKDDFFDNMSSDVVDRMQGKSTGIRRDEERALNVDTFGATGLQSGYRYRGVSIIEDVVTIIEAEVTIIGVAVMAEVVVMAEVAADPKIIKIARCKIYFFKTNTIPINFF